MAEGTIFTQKTTFGISSGPSYTGQTSVGPGANGNADLLIDAPIAHHASPGSNLVTVYNNTIDHTKVTAFGFKASLTAANGATSPTVTVTFTGGLSGPADLSYTLADGQEISFVTNPLTANPTSITVEPDATADFAVVGIVHRDI